MKSLLPIILIILVLTGAVTYSLSKRIIPKREENRFGIAANQLGSSIITPTASPTKQPTTKNPELPTVTPTPTKSEGVISTLPTVTEDNSETKGGQKTADKTVTKITKTIVCTPVYGQANTCTEHIVVDTGAADAIFFNFAGLSYLAGLAAFVKAKTLKK
ncbi:MAG: hypothetical protein UW64_C0020G0013 [Microgenomates group bacterium GW2011_GWC1_44_37]|uniref:Uncharacterized protein n=1 Tax=Candidatus Collierbacteria bacterium GW2011_GWB2_44_22 TaxID=1618387 RepID=A0A0G1HZD1_9BACT|nr:MAG: hypothetical protein UW31_C0002G0069 [Candidatus Collierbacteria bacterium GW2011_GWA2_44_13]KKT48340.1 MAG: hypothetical protein UW42_C0061G0005 [Candidatus Collierbacteria bacterium GW2011_GWB1_44_197]KKT51928.1 MAG: hypothetical protein UW44_C0006G0046 [Candidatus Collierbacteria bacterium GW2011_GWB2_44_22]KKT61224.1 MAG: hypothetical protein UW56_C0030G0007 [Candidatus Collierbacteria bacterium GW2011_GWD1_44_27]KKT64262.1 MAG: hypothetical protein UW58_C0048G0005 [Candidatus Colli